MNKNEKLDALETQIKEAAEGQPENFNLWREKTGVVLRNVLGDANQLYDNFTKIHYSLMMFSTDTPDYEFERAKQPGVREAIAILEAAKLEVEMGGGAPEATSARVLGQSVFVVHGHDDARKHETARALAKLTGNEPIILHEQANAGRTLIEKFEKHAGDVGYAVVRASPCFTRRTSSCRPTPTASRTSRLPATAGSSCSHANSTPPGSGSTSRRSSRSDQGETDGEGQQTNASAASKAGKTSASKTATPAQKSAAASALTQKGSSDVTGKSAASKAGKSLGSKGASKAAKSAAASALAQRPSRRK